MKDRFDKQHVQDLEDEKGIWDYYAKKGCEDIPFGKDAKSEAAFGKKGAFVQNSSFENDSFDDFHYEF